MWDLLGCMLLVHVKLKSGCHMPRPHISAPEFTLFKSLFTYVLHTTPLATRLNMKQRAVSWPSAVNELRGKLAMHFKACRSSRTRALQPNSFLQTCSSLITELSSATSALAAPAACSTRACVATNATADGSWMRTGVHATPPVDDVLDPPTGTITFERSYRSAGKL